jgi:hypothetical protein
MKAFRVLGSFSCKNAINFSQRPIFLVVMHPPQFETCIPGQLGQVGFSFSLIAFNALAA